MADKTIDSEKNQQVISLKSKRGFHMADKTIDSEKNQQVISLKSKQPGPIPPGKMSRIDVYKVIHASMNGATGRFAPFPSKFHVERDHYGEHQYLEETSNGVVRYVSPQRVVDCISQYSDGFANPNFELVQDRAKECFKYWSSLYPDKKLDIAPVREKSEPGLTFHRLPFDFMPGETPYFDELMSRTSNARALMAWIGSLFDFESERQSYVWIYGEGQNGKGTLARLLSRCLGDAARWDEPPTRDDKFWTSGLIGRRLVIFGDCNNYAFPISGRFKTLTGGDLIRVEEKGRPSKSVLLSAKFMFLSNDTPLVSSQKSDMRRAIFCRMKPIVRDIGEAYEQYLWFEAAHILHKCLAIYHEDTFTTNGRIIPEMDEIEAIASENEESMDVIFERHFNVVSDHDKEMKYREFTSPSDMQKVLKRNGLSDSLKQHRFLRYIKEKYNVDRLNVRLEDGKRQWRYVGITKIADSNVDPFF